jgi:hypothetical protein
MSAVQVSNRAFWTGLVFSGLVHAAAGVVLVAILPALTGSPILAAPPINLAQEDDPEERTPVRLGLRESSAVTVAWLGYETATEHEAPISGIEQSAMTLAQGSTPGVEGAADATVEEAQPDAGETAAGANGDATGRVTPGPEPVPESVRSLAAAIGLHAARVMDAAAESIAAGLNALPKPLPGGGTDRPDSGPGAGAASPSGTSGAGSPGEESNRESDATSLRKATRVVPGRVAAAEGLEILTRRPRWGLTTIATRSPANPVVRVTFGKDGRVIEARFVRDADRVSGTGYPDVDEPLITAIYRWTARGEALEALPEDDPAAGITVTLRVILGGG